MAKLNQAMQDLLRFNSAILPQKRSGFNKSHSVTTTLDSAYLIPLMWDRVLPADEKKIRYSGLARMATPIFPTMDEAYLDVWAFYVPDRLWWNHAKEFYGENLDASFNPDGEYQMPSLYPQQYLTKIGQGMHNEGEHSLNDYFGFPLWNTEEAATPFMDGFKCSAGLHRSYQLIWNEWFRNSSVQPALRLNTGDDVSDEEWEVIKRIRKVCKMPDFFTTLLREPQAGDSVTLPLGDWAPIVTRTDNVPVSAFPDIVDNYGNTDYVEPVHLFRGYHDRTGEPISLGLGEAVPLYEYQGNFTAVTDNSHEPYVVLNPTIGNLWANLTDSSGATINNLRSAITVQHLLEIDALGGKRYQNILQAHFGVLTPDATLGRPELLGLCRTRVGMRQVLQTSATEEGSPQGNTAAFSLTSVDNEWICNKAFTEPGFIMVLGAVRPVQSYSQGLNPLIRKLNRYDHYYPVFDNLGNQPVEVSTIYFTNTGTRHRSRQFDETFGYQEAWSEYRFMPNRVTGLMRPDVPGSLSAWNYSVKFEDTPSLTSEFVEEDPGLIDRTIAVSSEPQFILDSYFDYVDVKNMSVHSIPGLLRL